MDCFLELNNGRISNAITLIKCEKFTEKQKIKILNALRGLTEKITLNHEEVKILCELCCRDNIIKNKEDRDKYLVIVYYILKWFLDENCPLYVLELINYIRPTKLAPLEDGNLAVYKSYFIVLYNHIRKCYRNEELYDTDLLIQFSIIAIELFSAANVESKKSFPEISYIIKILRDVFKNDKIAPNKLHERFCSILRLSQPILSTDFLNKTVILDFFLAMTTITFSNFMKMDEDSVPNYAKDFITFVKSQNVLPYYLNYLKIINETLNLFYNIKRVKVSDAVFVYSKLLRELNKETQESKLVIEYMTMCINEVSTNAKVIFEETNWKKYMNSPLLCHYVDILLLLDSFSNDDVLAKYYLMKTTLQYIDISIKFCIENIEIVIPKLETVLKTIVKTLDKTNEKSQCQYLTTLYNILLRLNQKCEIYKDTINVWKIMCRAAYKYSIELLQGALLSLSICYLQTKQYRKGLTPLTLSLQIVGENKKIIQQWSLIKYNAYKENKEEMAVQTSIAHVFATDQSEMEQLCEGSSRAVVNMSELLFLEISGLVKWCEKCSVVTPVYKDFIEFTSTDVLQRARGLALLWNFHVNDTEFLNIATSTLTHLRELQKKMGNTESTFEIVVLMACLSCCIFQQKIYELRTQNYNNVLQSQTEEPIVSEHMKEMNMQMEIELIHYLDEALELFTTALGFSSAAKFTETLTKLNIPSVIQSVSKLYNLHGYQIQKIHAACLCLKYAELLKDNNIAVSIMSLILENIEYQSSSAKSLMEKADAVINDVDADILIKYLLSKSLCCYYSGEYEIGFTTLNEAHRKIKNSKYDSEYIVTKAKIDFVQSLYVLLPCRISQNTHPSTKGLITATDSFAQLSYLYKQHDQLSYKMKELNAVLHVLDLSLFISRKFIDMCLPKHARCYLRDQVNITTALCLPLRTAECLSVLALIDVDSSRYDDCRTKLDRVACLLGTKYSICDQNFLKHDDKCDCSKCTNIIYQQALFEASHVSVSLKNRQLDEEAADDYDLTFKNYKSVLKKQQTLCRNSKCNILVATDILKPVRLSFTVSYARFMHSYIEMLIRKSEWQVAFQLFDDIKNYVNDIQDMATEVIKNLVQSRASVWFSTKMIKSRNDENESVSMKLSTIKATPAKRVTNRQPTDTIPNFASPAPSLFMLPATTPSVKSNNFAKLQTPVANKFKIYTPATEKRYKFFKSKCQLDIDKKPTEPLRSPSPHNSDRLSPGVSNSDRLSPGVSDKQKSSRVELKDSARKTKKKTASKKLIDELKTTSETTETDAVCQLIENIDLNADEASNLNSNLNVLKKGPVRQYIKKQKKVLSEHKDNASTIDLISPDKVISEKEKNEKLNVVVNNEVTEKNISATDTITNFASPAPSLFMLPATTPSVKSNNFTKLQTPVANKFKIYTPATEKRYKFSKSKCQLDIDKQPTEPLRSPSPHNSDRLSPGVSDKQKSPRVELKDSVRKTRKKTASKKLIDELKTTSGTTATDAVCQLIENIDLNGDEASNLNSNLNGLKKGPVRQYIRKQKKVLSEQNISTINLTNPGKEVVSEKEKNEELTAVVNNEVPEKNTKVRKIAQMQKTSTVTTKNIETDSEINSITEKNENKPARRGRIAQLKKSANVDTNHLSNIEKTHSQDDINAKTRRTRLQKTSNSAELSKRQQETVTSCIKCIKKTPVKLKEVPGKKRILQLDESSDMSMIGDGNEKSCINKPPVKLKKVPGKKRLLQLDELSDISESNQDCRVTQSSVRTSHRLKTKSRNKENTNDIK